jgi:hypothetical protein
MIASLRRRYAENPIIFARVPREHWLALHRLAAARYATPGDIIREAVVNIITTADADRLPTTGSFNKPRPARTLIQYGLSRLGVSRWGRRLWWTMRMRANEGVCSVEIAAPHGFFGQMAWCLSILQYCELHGLIPDIRLTGDLYLDHKRGPNWLDYYFDVSTPISREEVVRRVSYTKKIHHMQEMGPPIVPRISLDEGARIFRKYVSLKSQLDELVDDFWKTLNVNGPVLGVHYRGTDKTTEAPRVSWDHCLKVLLDYTRIHPTIKAVFVASDEQKFIDFIGQSVAGIPVYAYSDHYRSNDSNGPPVHRMAIGEGGYEKGEDALVNALLLSRCSTLIRTTSFLSAWASIFTPDLKVILLNKPYDQRLEYPESEILKNPNTEYLPEQDWGSADHITMTAEDVVSEYAAKCPSSGSLRQPAG